MMIPEKRLEDFRRECLLLEGEDLLLIHGWLIGLMVCVERKERHVPYAATDKLIAELRASEGPDWKDTI